MELKFQTLSEKSCRLENESGEEQNHDKQQINTCYSVKVKYNEFNSRGKTLRNTCVPKAFSPIKNCIEISEYIYINTSAVFLECYPWKTEAENPASELNEIIRLYRVLP